MTKYYLIENFADILMINVLIYNHDISGKFLKEEKTGDIWFKETKSFNLANFFSNKSQSLSLEEGTPKSNSNEISWHELFKKLTIKTSEESKIAEEIIIVTEDKSVLTEIIRKHYLIQMGEIYYSKTDNQNWLIRIVYPSVWITSLIADQNSIYNKVSGFSQLFIQKGYEIKETYNLKKDYSLNIPNHNYILIDSNGDLQTIATHWRSANKIIEINGIEPKEFKIDADIKVEIEPKLIKAYDKKTASFWKVDDLNKLKKIITNYASEHLTGFKAWFTNDNKAYILSQNTLTDSAGIISLFNDAFPSYSRLKEKVFFPSGYSLMPLLDENRIFEVYNINNTDYICFDNDDGNMSVKTLSEKDMKALSTFIVYKVEKAVREIEIFDSQWNFDFGQLKKKTPIIRIEQIDSDSSDIYKGLKVKKGNKSSIADKKDNRIKRLVDSSDWEKLKQEIFRIDNALLENTTDTDLWLERSQISQLFGNQKSALLAQLTANIIDKDNQSFNNTIDQFIKESETPDFIQALKNNDEISKGKVLSNIRAKNSSAELNFTYQLYFAKNYQDKDIFDYAVEMMKKGYVNSEIEFHDFEEKSFGVDKKDNETLENKSIENIKTNINDFINILDKYDNSFKNIILRQFKIMLASNLPFATDDLIYIDEFDISDPLDNLYMIYQVLEKYPVLPQSINKSTEKWLSTLEMKNMKSIPIKDFFTGELYRSYFSSDFNAEELADDIYEAYISGDDNWDIKLKDSKNELERAQSQRILLQLVTKYSPLKDFRPFILEPEENNSYFNIIVMNCDIYRMNLRYGIKVDESRFFENIIKSVTEPFVSFIDFKDAVENIIFCLFISQSSRRREFLNQILDSCLDWYENIEDRRDLIEELLTTISFLEASILLDDIPDSVTEYNFKARKNSLWMEYAVYLKNNYKEFVES